MVQAHQSKIAQNFHIKRKKPPSEQPQKNIQGKIYKKKKAGVDIVGKYL